MKFIPVEGELDYPTGPNFTKNLPVIKEMASKLHKLYKNKDVYLWCRGSSGAIIAAIVAQKFKKVTINYIKKSREITHYYGTLSTSTDGINIIIDDFIATGATVNSIYRKLHKINPNLKVDCLCVSGGLRNLSFLKFNIDVLIAEYINYHDKNGDWKKHKKQGTLIFSDLETVLEIKE